MLCKADEPYLHTVRCRETQQGRVVVHISSHGSRKCREDDLGATRARCVEQSDEGGVFGNDCADVNVAENGDASQTGLLVEPDKAWVRTHQNVVG